MTSALRLLMSSSRISVLTFSLKVEFVCNVFGVIVAYVITAELSNKYVITAVFVLFFRETHERRAEPASSRGRAAVGVISVGGGSQPVL